MTRFITGFDDCMSYSGWSDPEAKRRTRRWTR